MCKLVAYAVNTTGNAFGASHCVVKCETHHWTFDYSETYTAETLCPLGRIEAKVDEALALIRAERDC